MFKLLIVRIPLGSQFQDVVKQQVETFSTPSRYNKQEVEFPCF